MVKILVLFDFNGTIVNDNAALYEFYKRVAWHKGFSDVLNITEYFEAIATKGYDLFRKEDLNIENVGEFKKRYKDFYRARLHSQKLFEGMAYALYNLANHKKVEIGLVTLQDQDLAEPLLDNLGIKELFTSLRYASRNKDQDIIDIIKERTKQGSKLDYTIYIGDMPFDIRDAKSAGAIPVSFLGGYLDKSVFAKTNSVPDKFIYYPKDIVEYVNCFLK